MPSAVEQEWVKSTDPRTGRVFYANRRTRKTQWEPPFGWIDEDQQISEPSGSTSNFQTENTRKDSSSDLPSNWEVMHDQRTGRPFYVDHVNKVTTWERPKPVKESPTPYTNHFLPDHTSTTNSSFFNSGAGNTVDVSNLYSQNEHSAWNTKLSQSNTKHPSNQNTVSFDSHEYMNNSGYNAPQLEFSIVSVKDEARANCPGCGVLFSKPLKRRHHCRLCGDVFCDTCTTKRALLPLDGSEFEKPVRVCDWCETDIQNGNYFTMRRYLPSLQTFDPKESLNAFSTIDDDNYEQGSGVTESQVCAALAGLTSDLDSVLMDATSFHEKITVPAETLVPAITRHLEYSGTSDRAICALSTLLALGKIVGDNSFANAVYMQARGTVIMDSVLKILEQSGSSKHTLFYQEQAARAIFYLSDEDLLSNITPEDQTLDLHRSLRNMLDHATCSASPSLQRWAAACIRNLIIQDMHRTTLYANTDTSYDSFTTQLVNTGGVMILCSLISNEDADTRAHAISALSAVIRAARNLNQNKVDSHLVTAIANSGGCGVAISQLLLSADTNVAQMSVTFASHLVAPLLGYKVVPNYLDSGLSKSDFLRPYCDAAIALVLEGNCLQALVQLIYPSSPYQQKSTPIELKVRAMETLSAITIACNSHPDSSSAKVIDVKTKILSLQITHTAFDILRSNSTQSLNSARDSPETQLREAAGLFIGQALQLDDSDETLNYLTANKAAIVFLTLAGDDGMFQPSGLVGEWAPRCLSWVEAASMLLTKVWYKGQSLLCKSPFVQRDSSVSSTSSSNNPGFSSEILDCLLEVIDAGAVQLLTQILARRPNKNTMGEEHLKLCACHVIAAMFGIAHGDTTNMGALRLYDAVQASSSVFTAVGHSRNGNDLIMLTLSFLQSVSRRAHNGEQGDSPLNELIEAALMAAGSVCGTYIGCNTKNNKFLEADEAPIDFTELVVQHDYTLKKEDTCNQAIGILFRDFNPFPSMLVGVYGEGSISPAIRLALVLAKHGKNEVRARLASTLIPLCDILRQALVDGDRYLFTSTITLVRYCGPYATSENGSRELLHALNVAIKTLASVVSVNENGYQTGIELETLKYLKENCIFTFEALSFNQVFWSTLATNAFGPIADFLCANDEWDEEDIHRRRILFSALSTVQNVIALPSNAVVACQAGLAKPLSRIVCGKKDTTDSIDKSTRDGRRRALQREKVRRESQIEYDVKHISLNLLHSLASNKEARQCDRGLIDCGVIRAACFALGGCTEGADANQTPHGSNTITRLGLEIIHFMLSDLRIPSVDNNGLLIWSDDSKKFVDEVARQSRFLRALCATMLLSWNDSGYTLPGNSITESVNSEIAPLYGSPFVTYDGTCAGYTDSTEASVSLLFSIAALCSSSDASYGEDFWDTFLMKEDRNLVNAGSIKETSITACAVFLSILMDEDEGYCVPQNENHEQFYFSHSLPTVRKRLLDGLSSSFSDVFTSNAPTTSEDGISALAVLKKFQVPSMCIALCVTPSLVEPAFHLIQGMTSSYPDEILPHMIRDELTLRAALHMLTYHSEEDESGSEAQIRLLFAKIICVSATKGILGPALESFDLRKRAISSLSAACKIGEDEIPQYCLRALVTIFSSSKGTLQLSSSEAKTIAKNLGGVISSMVLDRFAVRANEPHSNTSSNHSLEEEPEVELLCSLASYKEALSELCHVGGLEAISLVSSDGVPSAILAMHEVVKDDASVILDIEGHVSVMDVLNSDSFNENSSPVDDYKKFRKTKVSFEFLAALCKSSTKGRKAVSDAESCHSCIQTACDIICSYDEKKGIEERKEIEKKKTTAQVSELSKQSKSEKGVELDRKMASIAAISFLSELAHTKSSREKIFSNSRLLQVLVSLGKECTDLDIVIQSTRLLASLAPYVGPGIPESDISSSYFASIFSQILSRADIVPHQFNKLFSRHTSLKFENGTTPSANCNLVFASAAVGLEYVFNEMDISAKEEVFKHIFDHLMRLTEELSKSMFSRQRRSIRTIPGNIGLLASSISTLLLLWKIDSPESSSLMKNEYFESLMRLIIAHESIEQRFESEKSESEKQIDDELCLLTAARTQCLQFLSGVMRNNILKEALNISWSETILSVKAQLEEKKVDYMNSVEIFSNDKKVERMYDFNDVLDSIIGKNIDKVASMHALRIQERLGW